MGMKGCSETTHGIVVHDEIDGGWFILEPLTGSIFPVDWYIERYRNKYVELSITQLEHDRLRHETRSKVHDRKKA